MPKVSMLCPVYNGEKYLDQAVQSVLNQTYTDFEFILYDDKSTDGSAELLKRYAAADSRVKLFLADKNRGSLYARNELIKIASGEFTAWLDQDDWYSPDFLQDAVAMQASGDYDMIQFGNVERVNHDGTVNSHYNRYDDFIYIGNSCLEVCFPHLVSYRNTLWSRLIRTSVMKSAVFQVPEKRFITDDMFFSVSLFLATKRFRYADGKPYYHYRCDQGQWGKKLTEATLERLRGRCELTSALLLHWFDCLKQHGKQESNALRVCCECSDVFLAAAMVYDIPAEHRAEAESLFYSYFCKNGRLPNDFGVQYHAYSNRLKFAMQHGKDSIA